MKKYLFVLVMAAATTTIMAGEVGEKNMDDLYFSNNNPVLSTQEKTAIIESEAD